MSAGMVAYAAYARARDGKTHDGRDMPSWDNLGPEIQEAWETAAQAVLHTYSK